MRRRELMVSKREGIKGSKAVAGDVCLYNKTTDKLCIIPSDEITTETYPSSNYSPVGVVVVPGTHNVYGDGSCAVISLMHMDNYSPDNGSYYERNMYFGYYDTDINTLSNYNVVCIVGNNGKVSQTIISTINHAYLPSDKYTKVQNPYDKDTWYKYKDTKCYIPSPYNDDDTRNPAYYQTASPSSTANAMSDFDGVGNTTKLINLATAQSDWKTASTITNNGDSGYSPAACCCWRYHTEGTKQGDWYLPAMGELGYIMPKFNKIKQTISSLQNIYSYDFASFTETHQYWSSTEQDNKLCRCIGTGEGGVYDYDKNDDNYVRAFLRVK